MASTAKLKYGDKHFLTKVAESGQLELAVASLAAERASNPEVRSFAQQLVTDHTALSQQLDQLVQSKGIADDVAEYSYHPGPSAINGSKSANSAMSDTATRSSGAISSDSAATTPTTRNSTSSGVASNSLPKDSGIMPSSDPTAIGAGAPTGRITDNGVMPAKSTGSADWNDPTTDRHYKKLNGKSGAEFDQEFLSMMISDHEDDVSLFQTKAEKANDMDVRNFASTALPKLIEHLKRAQQIEATLK